MEINTHWHFDTQIAMGFAWDKLPDGVRLTFYIPFIVFCLSVVEQLPRVTDFPCQCPRCDWSGTVWDCEGDVDGDGGLGCPECLKVIEVKI
jgi:hypothetical protein